VAAQTRNEVAGGLTGNYKGSWPPVLFNQLVDDPSAHPDRFHCEGPGRERQRLFAIIKLSQRIQRLELRTVRWGKAQRAAGTAGNRG